MIRLVCLIPATALVAGTLFCKRVHATGEFSLPKELIDPLAWASPTPARNRLFASTDRNHTNQDYVTLAPKAEVAVVKMQGPGWITRLWTTSDHPEAVSTTLKPDSEHTACLLCDRGKSKFPSSLWGGAIGEAYYCYAPIRVGSTATLLAANHSASPVKFFYQVNFSPSESPPGTSLSTAQAKAVLTSWKTGKVYGSAKVQTRSASATIKKGRAREVASLKGPGVLTEITLHRGKTPLDRLRTIWLSLSWDEEKSPSIRVPLAYLFAQYFGATNFAALPLEVTNEDLRLRFPMPFERSAVIGLQQRSKGPPVELEVGYSWISRPTVPPYRLHIRYARERTRRNQPFEILAVTGAGCLVGYTMGFDGLNHRTLAFLEGNDQVEVDGDPSLAQEGTGTEDAFNSAWYFRFGTFARPCHGVTFLSQSPPRVSAYRFMFADRVSFRKSLRLRLQHGGRNSSPDCLYRAVVFWYQRQVSRTPARPLSSVLDADRRTGKV